MTAPLLLAFGTRADAIKMGPVAAALDDLGVSWCGLCTGQHTDLLHGTPAETDLRRSISLGIASHGNVVRWLATAEKAVKAWLRAEGADVRVVAVQGDTMSALAVARAAREGDKEVAHIEAGIRSGDRDNPWPEEETRCELTRVANYHFAPTSHAFTNLVREGVPLARIRTTGNTVVSALARYTMARPSPAQNHVVVTLHRREWLLGQHFMETLAGLLDEMRRYPTLEFFWPLHPAVKAAGAAAFAAKPDNVFLIEPQPYQNMAKFVCTALGIVTDSGGLQEEAATLGVPCAVMRYVTDRPESVEAGVARLFEPTAAGGRAAVRCIADAQLPRQVAAVFGSVDAADQVAQRLARLVETE